MSDTTTKVAPRLECVVCELLEEIAELKDENERLKKQALVWHKWPENEPIKSMTDDGERLIVFLVKLSNGVLTTVVYDSKSRQWSYHTNRVAWFAEIPEPEAE